MRTVLEPDADAANAAADDNNKDADAAKLVPTPPPCQTGAQQPHPAGRSLYLPPALGAEAGLARGWQEGVVKRLLARPKADAD